MAWFASLEQEDIEFFLDILENKEDIPHLLLDENLVVLECNQAFLKYTGLREKPLKKPAALYLEAPDQSSLEAALCSPHLTARKVTLVLRRGKRKHEHVCFNHYRRKDRHYLLAEHIILNEEGVLREFTSLSNRLTNLNRELTRKNREMALMVEELQRKEHSLSVKSAALEREMAERERIALSLEKAREEAEKANLMKSEFLAIMSHEIRNPMSVIAGITDLLAESPLSGEQQDYTTMIKEATESLLSIINDILDHSKIEAGKMTLQEMDFNLPRELASIMAFFKHQAESKNILLKSTVSPAVPPLLHGDPKRLRQVLVNLISNAIKFTDEGSVALAVHGQEQMRASTGLVTLRFAVSDTGIGIAHDKLDQLFKTYGQVDWVANRKHGGTGLGLVVSRQLVEMMGGSIEVSSREGRGSVFAFSLPFKVAAPSLAAAPAQDSALPAAGPKDGIAGHAGRLVGKDLSILLVEDKELNRRLATVLLEKQGWRVTTAVNGLEALALAEKNEFDLVLMDIQMPVMDGLEATQEIRKREKASGRRLPIIAMTAEAMKGDREKFIAAGMDSYLAKPVDTNDLYGIIGRLISEGKQD